MHPGSAVLDWRIWLAFGEGAGIVWRVMALNDTLEVREIRYRQLELVHFLLVRLGDTEFVRIAVFVLHSYTNGAYDMIESPPILQFLLCRNQCDPFMRRAAALREVDYVHIVQFRV